MGPELKILVSNEAPPVATASRFSKQFFIQITLFLVGVLIASLCYYWFFYSASHISTDNAYIESDLVNADCRIMGYVKEVLVSEGDAVKKGQTLLVLDDTDIKVELGFKQAKFEKAKADFDRGKKLIRSNAISIADLETAKANLSANRADLDGTLLKLQYTKLLAPVDGSVGKRNIQPDQFVQPGQSLFVIVPSKNYWIKANYKETQLEKIRPGQPVRIKVDAYPSRTWVGKVEAILPVSGSRLSLLPPENGSGNFTKVVQRIPVRISIENQSDIILRPGMSVQPTIVVE